MSPHLFLLIVSSVGLNAISHVLLRKAMLVVNASDAAAHGVIRLAIEVIFNPFLILGMTLYGASIVIWLFVLSKLEVSVAYPFQSLGYLIAAGAGLFLLGENVTIARAFGILLICAGLVFIARSA